MTPLEAAGLYTFYGKSRILRVMGIEELPGHHSVCPH